MDNAPSRSADSGHYEVPLPEGAQNWAIIASLLETCRLNAVDPLAWTSATLTKLAQGHGSKDLEVLMPWNFAKPSA